MNRSTFAGPTPTLNKLLQQRCQNSYSDGPQSLNKEHQINQHQNQQQIQQQPQQQQLYRNQESVSHTSNIQLDESSNSSERSTPTGKPTTPGPPTGPVRMNNHQSLQSHGGMSPSPGYGNNGPNSAYAYGNHYSSQYGVNNNMMPPPTGYPTKPTMPPNNAANGAQAAAAAAVIAAERSANYTIRSPHSSMYLRQHLQQRLYQPNSHYGPPPMSPMVPSGPMMHVPPGARHGMPPNEPIPPGGEPPNSMYPMGPSHVLSPPATDAGVGAATSVTQSITSPLAANPSLSNSIAEVRAGPQPPPILDEASQASTTSSQAEDSSDAPPKLNSKPPVLSHPPTPNTLGSPGAASLSSFHDEFESVSSPSWPRTPASPVVNSQGYDSHSGHNVKRPDGLMKLYDMSDEPDRRAFLDKLIAYQEERGTPISQCPTISKLPLDLYRLYMAVKERGGFVEVSRAKLWKECTTICNIANSSSAAYTLRKQYIKHLFPFECKFDRGGVDPQPILASMDSSNRKKNKNVVPPPEQPFQGHSGPPPMDGYGPPGSYPPQPFPQPNSMSNSEYPPQPPSHQPSGYPHPSGPPPMSGPPPHMNGPPPPHMSGQNPASMQSIANHNESISVKDPFADDIQHASGYPQQASQATGPQTQTGPTPPQHSNEYNINYNNNYSNTLRHNNQNCNPVSAQPSAQSNHPPPQNHFGEYNYGYNRQMGQTDPYGAPPPQSQGYPPTPRMSHPSPYYNQQPAYDSHRTDQRFEGHVRPSSQESMYGQQPPPQQPASVGGPSPRAQYPGGPQSAQPSAPHSANTPPSSTPNYSADGASQIGHYNQQQGYESHRTDQRFEGHTRPSSREPVYGQQPPPQPPVSLTGHPPRAQYPGGPQSAQPSTPHSANTPPSSTPNYSADGASQMGHYNQQQGYESHRTDQRFEGHVRPSSQESVYGQQPPQPQPPVSIAGHPPRAQYPGGPQSGQPSASHPPNTSPSSTPNYSRGGASPIGQYGAMGQQMSYNNSTADNFKPNDYQNAMLRMQSPLAQRLLAAKISQSSQNYSGSQPLYSSGSSAQQLGGMSAQKSGPTTGANTPQPQTQTGTTWHPSAANQFNQKRHPDFMKQEQHFPSVNNTYGSGQPSMPSLPPSGQFPPYSSSGSIRPTPPNPPTSQPPWNRDNQYRAYGPPSASHMPPNSSTPFGGPPAPHREGWDHMSRMENGPNWGPNRFNASQSVPPHELYSGPTPYGGAHQINKMSNYSSRSDQNRQYMSNIPTPNKVPPHMMGPHQSMGPMPYSHPQQHHPMFHQMKKEIIFPPDSVEATTPTISKRRRLCARDLSSVEAWRLIMCLKSGLLAESTWALDILSVLLHDDSTVLYFGLQHMPGMLEVLLEHYKRYLSDIFDGIFDDTEIGYKSKNSNNLTNNGLVVNGDIHRPKLWYELNKDLCQSDSEELEEDIDEERCSTPKKQIIPSEDQLVLLNTTNFTYKSRNGKPVRIKKASSLFIDDPDKKWDHTRNGFTGGTEHWTNGGGESTAHIQTHFESNENFVRFVRLIKKNRKRNRTSSFSWKMSAEDKHELKTINDLLEKNDCKQLETKNNLINKSEIKVEMSETNDINDNNNLVNNSDKESTKSEDLKFPRIRDSDLERFNKRKNSEEFEEESYDMEEPAVHVGQDYQDSLTRRCLCLSTLIRNLSFVPGNDENMSKHPGLLLVLSRLLLLHHSHISKKRNFERSIEDELFASEDREKNEKIVEKEWWWDVLHTIRENTLVTIANLSGQLDLSPYPEQISLPFLDGLLHWAVCPSSYAQDTLPSANYYLSPQRLAFESLSKLSILDSNVDLLLATPPWSRIDKLYHNLSRSLSRHEDQTIREFSVVLLSNLSSADSSSARAIALTGCAIPLLISFVEQAEQSALQVANSQGINALRENPELMGTTLDMVRRSASTLRCLSRVPDNRQLFLQFQQRLLALVMSQILDQGVAGIIADVIYECSLAQERNHLLTTSTTSTQSTTGDYVSNNTKIVETNPNGKYESNDSDESYAETDTEINSSAAEPLPAPEVNGEVLDSETTTSTDSNMTANT